MNERKKLIRSYVHEISDRQQAIAAEYKGLGDFTIHNNDVRRALHKEHTRNKLRLYAMNIYVNTHLAK